MKILLIALLLATSGSYGETKRQIKLEKKVVQAFKQKPIPKMTPKLEQFLNKKFYNFDGNRVIPSFSHNVFWLNHLTPNFTTTPRYNLETITNTITRVIPGREYTIPGGSHIEHILVGYSDPKIIGYEPGDFLGFGPDKIIGYGPETTKTSYGPWGNWTPITSNATVNIPGEKTMEGWAELYRANYLMGLDPSLTRKQASDQAKIDLAPCIGQNAACNVQIAIPPNANISGGSCASGATSECTGGLFITGSYSEPNPHPGGTPGASGEWKPEFSYQEQTRTRNEITETIPGDPIYGQGDPQYGPEKPVYDEGEPIYEDKEVKDPDEVVKEPDQEVKEDVNEERVVRAKKEWKFSFAPAFFFDYDFGELILNQNDGSGSRTIQSIKKPKRGRKLASDEDQDYFQGGPAQSIQQGGLPPSGIYSDTSGPYLVKKFFTITAGLGGMASANYVNAGILSQLGLSVALLPALGGGAYSIMIFDNYEDAEKAKHLKIPRSPEDILNWRVGDTLQYEVHGGVVFTGGAGFYGLAAGVDFMAQGFWQRTFSRVDANTVLAKLDKNRIFSLGMYGAAGLAAISLDKFWAKNNALTFAIDISKKRGKDLLLDFMKGDMRKLQAAAENDKDLTVVSGMKIKGKTKGKSFSFGIGIPYLPASARWNKANFLSESNSEYLGSNRKKIDTMNAEILTFKGKFFPLFKNTTEGFTSTVTENLGTVPVFLSSLKNGQYAFTFQRSYADKKDLEKVIKSLLKKTGLIGLLDVKIGDNIDKVGSAEIKFAVKLKTPATNLLIAQSKGNNLKILDQIGQGFINSYFNSLDRKKDDSLELCPARTLKGCKERMSKESMKAFLEMKKSLIAMSNLDTKSQKSRERLARAYTKFGDAMMENPFTLQTVLALTLGQGAEVYFSVETSKTRKYEAILRGYPSTSNR